MAEKYGEVPPKFTKQWWEYFWDYYKWYVIATVIVLVLTLVTIEQCTSSPNYDMKVTYTGYTTRSESDKEKMRQLMTEYVSDIDENGEVSVGINSLVYSTDAANSDYNYAVNMKFETTFVDHFSYMYLLDERGVKEQLSKEDYDGLFECFDEYIGDDEVIRGIDGKAYAVSLKNSRILNENAMNCDDLYVMVRQNYKDDEKNIQSHSEALEAMKAFIAK